MADNTKIRTLLFSKSCWQTTLKLAVKRGRATQWCCHSLLFFFWSYSMSQYSISQARSIAISCATHYNNQLKDKQFIVIYRDSFTNQVMYIELVFLSRNYQHLTGLLLLDNNRNLIKGASEFFYEKCLTKKLGNNEIAFRPDGTTQLKLEALPAITKFTSITKIIGDSNGRQPFLYVEKIVGNINFCLGLRIDKSINQYVPVSALKQNIKDLTDKPSQVLAIFERPYGSSCVYKMIRHVAKGLDLNKLSIPADLSTIISLEDYRQP